MFDKIGEIMRAVVSADWHFSRYAMDDVVPESRLPQRLHSLLNALHGMVEYMNANGITTMIVPGDIFHNKAVIHSLGLSLCLDFVRSHPQVTFYFIDGNHDLSSMSGNGVSALKALEKEPNTIVVHESLHLPEDDILLVPWNSDMIDTVKNNKAKYLLSHFGLNEGTLSSGVSIVADIGIGDLKNYQTVILGHYHKPQDIVGKETHVYYVGSPIQLDRGERNEEKRFLDIDFSTGEIESILTEGYKKYFRFDIDKETNVERLVEQANELKLQGHEVSMTLLESVTISPEIKLDDFQIVDKRDIDITNRGISIDMAESDRLKKYCEIQEVPEDDVDLYIQVGLELMNMGGEDAGGV